MIIKPFSTHYQLYIFSLVYLKCSPGFLLEIKA